MVPPGSIRLSASEELTVLRELANPLTNLPSIPKKKRLVTRGGLEAVWADLLQAMQDQVRIAIVNMVAERDGEKVAAWSTVRSILAEVSYLGWQRVWRMVGAMPADAQPVVTSAFADTPMDIRGRVREIVTTRAESDARLDQRLTEVASRIEGVDQAGLAGLAELASEGGTVEQNVVYHLPKRAGRCRV